MTRKWDIQDEQLERKCIDELLTRIDEQEGEAFGLLAAKELIDIVAGYVGPAAYNAGIEEAKKSLQANIADLEVDLDLLKRTS